MNTYKIDCRYKVHESKTVFPFNDVCIENFSVELYKTYHKLSLIAIVCGHENTHLIHIIVFEKSRLPMYRTT